MREKNDFREGKWELKWGKTYIRIYNSGHSGFNLGLWILSNKCYNISNMIVIWGKAFVLHWFPPQTQSRRIHSQISKEAGMERKTSLKWRQKLSLMITNGLLSIDCTNFCQKKKLSKQYKIKKKFPPKKKIVAKKKGHK